MRPDDIDPTLWYTWCERIERDIEDLRSETHRLWPWLETDWLQQHWIRKILRQLAIREIRQRHTTGRTDFDHLQPPLRCPHPHSMGRLWTTSVWNWLWLLIHLVNQREDFTGVWVHVHHYALSAPPPRHSDVTGYLLSTSVVLCRWIRLMSDRLTHLLRESETDTDPTTSGSQTTETSVTDTEEEEGEEESTEDPRWMKLYTQPPTPEPDQGTWWSDGSGTDTDNDSVPSSLDTYLFETFRDDDTTP